MIQSILTISPLLSAKSRDRRKLNHSTGLAPGALTTSRAIPSQREAKDIGGREETDQCHVNDALLAGEITLKISEVSEVNGMVRFDVEAVAAHIH